MRTGDQYRKGLADGRLVYVDGVPVTDVPEHPAFAGVVSTVAALYDFAADPVNGMTYLAPETGRPALKSFMIPRSVDDLEQRRHAVVKWAEQSKGFLGRSPDHVASFFAGFASNSAVFDRDGHSLGANVRRWYTRILDESAYLSYAIIPPQTSRWKDPHGLDGDLIQVGVVAERPDGIVVRGSQMLGTATAISDYVFVTCLKPLQRDDEEHAVSFVVPIAAPGLKVYCRRPYALGQPSRYDYPLSTQFDETDALVVFDDVFIPWSDVFVCRDVDALQDQFFLTPAHILGNSQATARLSVKLKFLLGIAYKVCLLNRTAAYPSVVEKLAELASLASVVEGMSLAADSAPETDERGVVHPNRRFLYGLMGLQAELYPRVVNVLRDLVGGGVMMVPSSYRDLVNDETKADMRRYMQISEGPEDRVQLLKLAWDAIGSEFAGRHHQYELFYAGAPVVTKAWTYRNYGIEECEAFVDDFLRGYSVEDPGPAAPADRRSGS
jgi:4-hydroxyphenylacetate 3-monooxygenase